MGMIDLKIMTPDEVPIPDEGRALVFLDEATKFLRCKLDDGTMPAISGIGGATGAKGDKGDPGTDGTDGTNGTPGTPGIQGLKGDPGTNGTNGTPGIQGIQGIQGLAGATGATGAAGTTTISAACAATTLATSAQQIGLTLLRDDAHVHVDATCLVANNGYAVGNVIRQGVDGFNFTMKKVGTAWTLATRAGFPQWPNATTGLQFTAAANQWTIRAWALP